MNVHQVWPNVPNSRFLTQTYKKMEMLTIQSHSTCDVCRTMIGTFLAFIDQTCHQVYVSLGDLYSKCIHLEFHYNTHRKTYIWHYFFIIWKDIQCITCENHCTHARLYFEPDYTGQWQFQLLSGLLVFWTNYEWHATEVTSGRVTVETVKLAGNI